MKVETRDGNVLGSKVIFCVSSILTFDFDLEQLADFKLKGNLVVTFLSKGAAVRAVHSFTVVGIWCRGTGF